MSIPAACPLESIVPRDVISMPLKLMMPRYEYDVSAKMILGMTNAQLVTNVPTALGKSSYCALPGAG